MNGLGLTLDPPLPQAFETGRGGCLVLRGVADGAGGILRSLEVEGGDGARVALFPAADGERGQHFFAMVDVKEERAGSSLRLRARGTLDGGRVVVETLGECVVTPLRLEPVAPPAGIVAGDPGRPLVAICMATYDPAPGAFRRQVDSIREQGYDNWICIINDDHSPAGTMAEMERICAEDERFLIHRNDRNLGFYANFEQALRRVPAAADYVAYADQDDRWYPDKLEKLLAAMAPGVQLAYGDVRIVAADGSVVADTYWRGRRNEYRDFTTVLLANTVTGAASLFRRELLYDLLPFPDRVGDAFHDHWTACVALARGRLAYVDEPLHDYYQHGESVIGHCDFVRWTLRQRLASLGRFALRLLRPAERRGLLGRKIGSSLAVYRGECLRLELFTRTIKLRLRLPDGFGGPLNLFNGGVASALKLLGVHLKILATGRTTDDAEFRLAMGYLARAWERRRIGGGASAGGAGRTT